MKRLCLAIILLVAMSSYAHAATFKVKVYESIHYYFIDPETGHYSSTMSPVDRPNPKWTITTYDIDGDVDVEITHKTKYIYADGELFSITKITRYEDTSPFFVEYTTFYHYKDGVMYYRDHYYRDSDSSDY